MKKLTTQSLLLVILLPLYTLATAQPAPTLAACAEMADDAQRLKCYDLIARGDAKPKDRQERSLAAKDDPSPLTKRWGFHEEKKGLMIRPHEPMYLLLARHSSNPNTNPTTPTQSALAQDIDSNEAKYQFSMKFRAYDSAHTYLPDLWFAYTQQSQWQVYNDRHSRPFRETNYMPEAILAWHPQRRLGPLNWRLFSLGYLHQSNGRADPLSRSWDRVYAQLGFDTNHFTLLVRPWIHLQAGTGKDDNPDITHYLGYGDLVLSYQRGKHQFSTKLRGNPAYGKAYGELTWRYELGNGISTYLQASTGYGESLIDYNVYQTTISAGFALYDW